jgi:hypothetical protein
MANPRPMVLRRQPDPTESSILLAELLDSDAWFTALEKVVAPILSEQRTQLQSRARESVDPDLALLAVARSQARIDAIVALIFKLYETAGVPQEAIPQDTLRALSAPGKLK